MDLPWVWSLRRGAAPAVCLPEWRQVSAPACPPECLRWRRYEEHWSAPRHLQEFFHSCKMDKETNEKINKRIKNSYTFDDNIYILLQFSSVSSEIGGTDNSWTVRMQHKAEMKENSSKVKLTYRIQSQQSPAENLLHPAVRAVCRLHLKATQVIRLGHMTHSALLSWPHAVLIPVGLTGNYSNSGEETLCRTTCQQNWDIYFQDFSLNSVSLIFLKIALDQIKSQRSPFMLLIAMHNQTPPPPLPLHCSTPLPQRAVGWL